MRTIRKSTLILPIAMLGWGNGAEAQDKFPKHSEQDLQGFLNLEGLK